MSYGWNTRSYSGRTASSFSRPVETGKEYTVDVTDNGREGVNRRFSNFCERRKGWRQKYKS